MTSNPKERGVLAKVEVTYPDGRTVLRTLLFPNAAGDKRWMGINICECGESIQYDREADQTLRQAVCSACGIVFAVKKP